MKNVRNISQEGCDRKSADEKTHVTEHNHLIHVTIQDLAFQIVGVENELCLRGTKLGRIDAGSFFLEPLC